LSVALPDQRGSLPRARERSARVAAVALAFLGAAVRRAAAWLYRALPALGAGLAAAIPVLVSTIHAVAAGWEPAGDDGIIVTRAWDVLTAHSPLVGQYSEAGTLTGQVIHSPGPLLYWLLALPARFGSAASIAVTMGAVNTLAIVGSVVLARRRGGLVLMFATAAGIALMCQSLPAETFHDPWNPAAGLFPFLLAIFLCWSLACGDHRTLPLTVLVASFLVQTHLTYLAPTAGILTVGLVALLGGRVWARRNANARASAGSPARPIWRWVLAATLVAAVCWTLPAIDELENSPGNMSLIVQSVRDRGPTLGANVGWNAVVRAVGMKPWWLYVPATAWERKLDVRATPTSVATDSTLALLAALALVATGGLIRRRRDVAAAALIALVLCAALDAVVAQTPIVPLLAATVGYTAWWGSMLGLWVWLVLAWSLWLSLRWLVLADGRLGRGVARWVPRLSAGSRRGACAVASLACLGGVIATGTAVAATQRPDSHARQYHPIAAMAARLDQLIPPNRTVRLLLGPNDVSTQPIEPAVRYGLVRHGDVVLARGSYRRLGRYYELDHKHYGWLVYLADGSQRRRNMLRAITVHFADYWGRHTFSAWIARVGPRGALEPPRAARGTVSALARAGRRPLRSGVRRVSSGAER
jgi:hypothetical protein